MTLPIETKIPENPLIEPYSITLFDIIDFDIFLKSKKRFIRLFSRFEGGFLTQNPEQKLNSAFEELKDSYKTVSYGNIFFNNLKKYDKADLIDGISYSYVKGQQSYIILNYQIFPSQKFKNLFKKALIFETKDKTEIIFNSLKNILKGKRTITSIFHKPTYPDEIVQKLINELNYQFKKEVISDVKCGLFNTSKNTLFPTIVSYEYDEENSKEYFSEIVRNLGIIDWDLYYNNNIIFHLPSRNFKKLDIFVPKISELERKKNPFISVDYMSDKFKNALSPFWTLLNISELVKPTFVSIQRKTFKYLKKNKDSIFLKKAIKLKNELNMSWWKFERMSKDFSSQIYYNQLKFRGIPDLFSRP